MFIVEQGVPEREEWDDADPVYLATFSQLRRNVTQLARPGWNPPVRSARVAVLPQYRGTGIGVRDHGRPPGDAGAELGLTQVHLNSQASATGFYERLGFLAEGPEFDGGRNPASADEPADRAPG